jgi:hypothetical protein
VLDLVTCKHEMFAKRFQDLPECSSNLLAQVEFIREDLFGSVFEDTAVFINKFQVNFHKLKNYMATLDKEVNLYSREAIKPTTVTEKSGA